MTTRTVGLALTAALIAAALAGCTPTAPTPVESSATSTPSPDATAEPIPYSIKHLQSTLGDRLPEFAYALAGDQPDGTLLQLGSDDPPLTVETVNSVLDAVHGFLKPESTSVTIEFWNVANTETFPVDDLVAAIPGATASSSEQFGTVYDGITLPIDPSFWWAGRLPTP